MRSSRLLGLLLILQTRGRVSARVLAGEFEVSVRTIYRDVDALSASGVPVYAEPGRSGGIALHEGYRTRLTGLTADEAATLPLTGVGKAARDLGVGEAAITARAKLTASLAPASNEAAQRVSQRFHLDSIPWYGRPEFLPSLPEIAEAVWRERRIALVYDSWAGVVRRRVDPLGLVQKGGLWYLVAAVRGRPRTYRIASIVGHTVLDLPVRRPKTFDLARYWSDWSANFEDSVFKGRARVRISPEGRRILRAAYPAIAVVVEESAEAETPDGWVMATLPFEDAHASRQILRLGTEVEVLAPVELRTAVWREARAVARLHHRPRSAKGGTVAVA
jgi:predicted DNA-binding transcriptional regulator YafY